MEIGNYGYLLPSSQSPCGLSSCLLGSEVVAVVAAGVWELSHDLGVLVAILTLVALRLMEWCQVFVPSLSVRLFCFAPTSPCDSCEDGLLVAKHDRLVVS